MLWAAGSAMAWGLLRTWPQLALTAVLAPAWLVGEWIVVAGERFSPQVYRPAYAGVFLLALAYFTAARPGRPALDRTVLVRLGGVTLPFAALVLAFGSRNYGDAFAGAQALPRELYALGWTTALALPLILAVGLRRRAAWPNVLAMLWVLVLLNLHALTGELSLYAWWAAGGIAMAAWGVSDGRVERINMGSAIFAATIVAFYFSTVMDKVGRSASLIGLGLLFLAGGWAIERVRRRLVSRARGEQ
jgi:hypothetical protein